MQMLDDDLMQVNGGQNIDGYEREYSFLRGRLDKDSVWTETQICEKCHQQCLHQV